MRFRFSWEKMTRSAARRRTTLDGLQVPGRHVSVCRRRNSLRSLRVCSEERIGSWQPPFAAIDAWDSPLIWDTEVSQKSGPGVRDRFRGRSLSFPSDAPRRLSLVEREFLVSGKPDAIALLGLVGLLRICSPEGLQE